MSVEIRPLDITKYKGDVIVNSLGAGNDITTYGKICQSIVKAACSADLEKKIREQKPNAKPGLIFQTIGYSLKPKIIHVVPPYFSHDNQLFGLEFCYKLILEKAFSEKLFQIALPIIGTGANGYPHAYAFSMVKKLCEAFSKMHKEMKITICVPVKTPHEYNEKFNDEKISSSIKEFFSKNNWIQTRDFEYTNETFEKFEHGNIETWIEFSANEIIGEPALGRIIGYKNVQFLDEKEALLDSGKEKTTFKLDNITSIYSYIEKYISEKYGNNYNNQIIENHTLVFVNGDEKSRSVTSKHKKSAKRETATISMLMRYVLTLHMTLDEANDFLTFCGKCFSPISYRDKVYQELILQKKYVTKPIDVDTINSFCYQQKIDCIFGYAKQK